MEQLLQHLDRTSEGYQFQVEELVPGVRLHVQPTKRFKSVTTKIYQLNPLGPESAERALIPMVLRCGCEGYPTRKQIAAQLQALFGATMNVNAVKFGHAHMQKYELSYVSSRFLSDHELKPEESQNLLQSILTRPVTEDTGGSENGQQFRTDRVQQQREQLLDLIDSRKEDRRSYAVHRCIKHLYMESPYRYSKYGERDRVESLTPGSLYDRYTSDLSTSRFDVVLVGDVDEQELPTSFTSNFTDQLPERAPAEVQTVSQPSPSGDARWISEPEEGDQCWLVMGYQTPIVMGHADMYKLSMMAGLFGGFPHSKLHQNVREDRGLAYDVQASLKRSVGLLLVTAGIEAERKEETVEAVKDCRHKLVDGEFSDQELDMTRRKLIEQLVDLEDSPSQKADSYHNRYLAGQVESLSDVAEKVMDIEDADVREVAEGLSLQIVYSLD